MFQKVESIYMTWTAFSFFVNNDQFFYNTLILKKILKKLNTKTCIKNVCNINILFSIKFFTIE